jgi:tetratricopeptide (TPR) repeat protein
MQEERERLNEELERDYGVRIESRTGVNTGEVVAGEGETLATGDAVNVAARLEQAASVGEILVGDTTYKLVRDAVEVEPVEPLELKGKAEPVPAYRLLEITPGVAGHARRLDSPMVGRENERARLGQAFEQALRDRSCQLFTVLGAAGVGKSRLVAEFLVEVEPRAIIIRGRCLPYGEGITYWPLAEAVKEAALIEENDPPDRAREKLAAVVEGVEHSDQIQARVNEVLGLAEGGAGSEETFWAIRKLFEALGGRRPLVVVFDDVHWAESTFLDLVEHVADWSREVPILLLCLGRPELLDSRQNWGGGKLNATSVLLEPLNEDEARTLVENLLGEAELSGEVRSRIVEAAEGNPLFVEELLAMLIDDGLLERNDGTWTPTADLSSLAIPPTIQVLLAARLDRLEAEERAVIERASVEGKVFHRGSVAELSPEPARLAVPGRLMTLVRKELIRPDHAAFAGEDAFRFRHLLIRDAAYEAMPKEARADLHERFATWLEQKVGERVAEYEEILGYHLEQAFGYREQLGPLDDRSRELAARASERLRHAAGRASVRGDLPAAVKLYERACALLPEGDPSRARALAELGTSLGLIGRFERSVAVFEQAIERAQALGDRASELWATVERYMVKAHFDPTITGEGLARLVSELIPELEALGEDSALARSWGVVAHAHLIRAQAGKMEEALEKSVEYARRAGDRPAEVDSLMWLARVCWFGPVPTDVGVARCQGLAEQGQSAALQTVALQTLGLVYALRGDFVRGRELLARARESQDELGMAVAVSGGTLMMWGNAEALSGDWLAAEKILRMGYEQLEEMGETGFLSTEAGYLANVLYELGRYDEAEEMAETGRKASAADDISSQILWRSAQAKVLARRGDFEGAEALAREAVALARQTDYLIEHGDALLALAEVLRLAAGRPGAKESLEEALALYARKQAFACESRARALLEQLETDSPVS